MFDERYFPKRSTGGDGRRAGARAQGGAPEMKNTWRKIQQLGLLVQIQLLPYFAAPVGVLASGFPDTPVLIDHLGWPNRGTPAEYEEVLKLAKLPGV